jgi:excisionase family DNA binding protein
VAGFLSLGEVASLMRCSPQTIRRWLADGVQFPRPVRVRRRLLFDAREIDVYLQQLRAADTMSAD